MPVIDREKLEDHVRDFDMRIRRRNSMEFAALGLVAVVFAARALGFLPGLRGNVAAVDFVRIGDLLITLAAGFAAWQIHARATPVDGKLKDAGLLDFHIDQLQRQSAALKASAWWYAAPFLPGLVLIFGGHAAVPNAGLVWPLAGGALALVILAVVVRLNAGAAAEFDAEIRWLEEMERQSLT